jgi:hypothetical protein
MTTPSIHGGAVAIPVRTDARTPELDDLPHPGLDANQVAALRLDLDKLLGGLRSGTTEGTPAPGDDERSEPADMDAALQAAQDDLATDMYAFMAMYMKIAQQMRTSAREQRAAELQSQMTSLENAAEHMLQAAQERFNAALTSGIFQIASGAISIGSALGTLRAMSKAGKAPDAVPGDDGINTASTKKVGPDLSPGSEFMVRLKAKQDFASGGAQVLSGIGGIASGSLEQQAAQEDAAAKQDEAAATAAQARRDAAQEVMQTMAETIKDIREKLAAIVQSQIETNRGIARNI